MKKRIAIILNGCGAKDGSEIHEATLTLLGLDLAGVTAECFALDLPQTRVVNHFADDAEPNATRNMLVESARIARGKMQDLQNAKVKDFAGVIIPGGTGTAYNLCNFAEAGEKMTVNESVARFLTEMHNAGKPIGAICIAPVIIAKLFGPKGVHITLGLNNSGAAAKARLMGAETSALPSSECLVDISNKIVTAPAYMNDASIKDVWAGIKKLTEEVVDLAQ